MYLYELKQHSRIKEEAFDERGQKLGEFIVFHHPDDMHSYCTIEGTDKVINLNRMTPVEKQGDHYIISRT